MCTILQAASFIFLLVAHPETKYHHPPSSASTPSPPSTVVEVTQDKPSDDNSEQGPTRAPSAGTSGGSPVLHKGKPTKEQFSIIPRLTFSNGLGPVIRDVISPVQILFYPIVLWAALAMGFASNSLLALNITQAQVFGAPPYMFTPDQIGLVNFAFVVGAAIALVTAGPYSDWIALRKARKNNGILEAEYRLSALIPYVAISLIGMVITAVGYQRSWPWPAIVVVG